MKKELINHDALINEQTVKMSTYHNTPTKKASVVALLKIKEALSGLPYGVAKRLFSQSKEWLKQEREEYIVSFKYSPEGE